jgi:hypothetical protein
MNKHDPDELIAWRGVVISRRDAAMVVVCEQELGYELSIIKAYEAGESAVSASTHTGLGVLDLAPYDAQRKLKVLKKYSAAYYRRTWQGPWSEHIHLCSFNQVGMDPLARAQIGDYQRGLDGLAGHNPDPDPWRHPDAQPFIYYKYLTDEELNRKITTLKGRLKKVADRISALRAKRKTLRAQIKAAKDGRTYLH